MSIVYPLHLLVIIFGGAQGMRAKIIARIHVLVFESEPNTALTPHCDNSTSSARRPKAVSRDMQKTRHSGYSQSGL